MATRELRPAPPPREVNVRLITGIGTALWGIACVVLLLMYSSLEADNQLGWLWTAIVGFSLGVFGYGVLSRPRKSPPQPSSGSSLEAAQPEV